MPTPADYYLLTCKDFWARIAAQVPSMLVWMSLGVALALPVDAHAAGGALAMVRTPERHQTESEPALAPLPPVQEFGLAPGQTLWASLHTSLGTIECALLTESAPTTVATFVGLAKGQREWFDAVRKVESKRPLYNGTVFHRVIPGFLVQGGDPTGTGTGGPGFALPDENLENSVFERAGAMGLATRGANTGGSQFFVTAGPAHHLDGHFTRFGTCGNPDVLAAIAAVPRDDHNRPTHDVVLRSVEVVAR